MKTKYLLISILVLVVALLTGFLYKINTISDQAIVDTNNDKAVSYVSLEDKIKHSQPFTLLLLGYAGGKHDGKYLTDSIMVVHANPAVKKISLLSIPRDTWVTLPLTETGNKNWKINSAYQIGSDDKGYPDKKTKYTGEGGGGALIKDVVTQVTGQEIDRFVAIDFAGFMQTIDTLGGVDIQVETSFDDYAYPLEVIPDESCGHTPEEITAFIATTSAEQKIWEYFPCRYKHLHFDAGLNHMDGKTALEYVRSRHSSVDGSDFGRAKRQRNLLLAVKSKILSPAFITQIVPFMESLGNDLRTDITLTESKLLLQKISELSTFEIQTYALTDKNYLNQTISKDGQAILAPKEGIDNWKAIHQWINSIFTGSTIATPAIVLVENGTKTSGLAQKASDALNAKSIQTATPINNPIKTDITTITIFDKNINPDEIALLMKEFGVESVSISNAPTTDYNILVILGKDYLARIPTPTLVKLSD